MLRQIYRRPPCRRAISIKLCSNIIETAAWFSPADLLTDFLNIFYSEQLGEAAFRDSYLLANTQAQFFLCICLYLYRKQNSASNEFKTYLFT